MDRGLISRKLRGFYGKQPRVDRYMAVDLDLDLILGPWIEIQRRPWVGRLGRRRRVCPAAAHGGGLAGLRRNGGPGHGFGSRLAGKRAGAMENSFRGSGRGAEDRRAVLAGGAARRINDERLRARGAARERRKSGQRGSLPCSGAPAVACGDKEGARRRI